MAGNWFRREGEENPVPGGGPTGPWKCVECWAAGYGCKLVEEPGDGVFAVAGVVEEEPFTSWWGGVVVEGRIFGRFGVGTFGMAA
jgi:hypothetical protein